MEDEYGFDAAEDEDEQVACEEEIASAAPVQAALLLSVRLRQRLVPVLWRAWGNEFRFFAGLWACCGNEVVEEIEANGEDDAARGDESGAGAETLWEVDAPLGQADAAAVNERAQAAFTDPMRIGDEESMGRLNTVEWVMKLPGPGGGESSKHLRVGLIHSGGDAASDRGLAADAPQGSTAKAASGEVEGVLAGKTATSEDLPAASPVARRLRRRDVRCGVARVTRAALLSRTRIARTAGTSMSAAAGVGLLPMPKEGGVGAETYGYQRRPREGGAAYRTARTTYEVLAQG